MTKKVEFMDLVAPEGSHWDGGSGIGMPMLVWNDSGQRCGCVMVPSLGLFRCKEHKASSSKEEK